MTTRPFMPLPTRVAQEIPCDPSGKTKITVWPWDRTRGSYTVVASFPGSQIGLRVVPAASGKELIVVELDGRVNSHELIMGVSLMNMYREKVVEAMEKVK